MTAGRATAVILGCGASPGVPSLGTPRSYIETLGPRDFRTRSSLWVFDDTSSIVIDTSPDLRTQGLRENIGRIDAVLYTHVHADHIHGIDDLRSMNFWNGGKPIRLYGVQRTMDHLGQTFRYIFYGEPNPEGPVPLLERNVIEEGKAFRVGSLPVVALPIYHGQETIVGFKIGRMAYLTDCSGLPEDTAEQLRGLDVLILSALRKEGHSKHFTVDEAVEAATKLEIKRAILTHMSGSLKYDDLAASLPPGIEPAYDGMRIDFNLESDAAEDF